MLPVIYKKKLITTDQDGLVIISKYFITMSNFSGFVGNQFDNGEGNKVYLQSDTHKILCQIHPDGTNENQITIITPASEFVIPMFLSKEINVIERLKGFSKLEF